MAFFAAIQPATAPSVLRLPSASIGLDLAACCGLVRKRVEHDGTFLKLRKRDARSLLSLAEPAESDD